MEGTGLAPGRSAVFLDRDGTLIEDVGYLDTAAQIEILPGVPEALRRLREAGFLLIVVTNQSAVARGWLTERRLESIHQSLNAALGREGVAPDAYYYCPHLPDGEVDEYARACACRKPAPGLLMRAAKEWGIALERSYAVGDSERDVEAGRRVGCCTILVGDEAASCACARAKDLPEAAELILRREAGKTGAGDEQRKGPGSLGVR